MKRIILIALLFTSFITSASAQVQTTIKGVVKNNRMPKVTLFETSGGLLKPLTTVTPDSNGKYSIIFTPPKAGFYSLGDLRANFVIYAKGGEEINIDLLSNKAVLNGKNTPENKTLYQWENAADSIRCISSMAFGGGKTYKDFFPEFEKVLAKVPTIKQSIHSGNNTFDELLKKKIDYDLDYYAIGIIMTPRIEHPKRENWLAYYDTIISDKKFTSCEVLQFPAGMAMVNMYANFTGLVKAKRTGIDALNNDTLQAEAALFALKISRSRDVYENNLERFAKYLKTPEQKEEAQSIAAKFPASLNGKPAIDFTYPDKNGKDVSLSDFKGKVVLIDVWATWCNPCRQEMPALKKLEQELHGKDVVFLGVSIDRDADKEKWLNFVNQEGLQGIQLHASGGEQLSKDYSISGIPRFILIDKQGNIAAENAPRPSSSTLKELIEKELAK